MTAHFKLVDNNAIEYKSFFDKLDGIQTTQTLCETVKQTNALGFKQFDPDNYIKSHEDTFKTIERLKSQYKV